MSVERERRGGRRLFVVVQKARASRGGRPCDLAFFASFILLSDKIAFCSKVPACPHVHSRKEFSFSDPSCNRTKRWKERAKVSSIYPPSSFSSSTFFHITTRTRRLTSIRIHQHPALLRLPPSIIGGESGSLERDVRLEVGFVKGVDGGGVG
jgi:hypothetical protein